MTNVDLFIRQTAKELDLPIGAVRDAYMAMWKFINKTISSYDFSDEYVETREEFSSHKNSFDVRYIGKIYLSYDWYLKEKDKIKQRRYWRRYNAIKQRIKNKNGSV